MRYLKRATFLFLLLPGFLTAQTYELMDTVRFIENGDTLKFAYAGGFNQPQFSNIDLNGDSIMDLFVFEREDNRILTFLNSGASGIDSYTYAPQYETDFPYLHDWALLRDYNCDGKQDIFTAGKDRIALYKNTSSGGNLSFQLISSKLMSFDQQPTEIYLLGYDLPAIDDIDGDGDIDILLFEPSGSYVQWHSNQAIDTGSCDSISFKMVDGCWGKFFESGLSNLLTLNSSCKTNNIAAGTGGGAQAKHAGSTILTFDEDGDGDKELLLGDLLSNAFVYTRNGGTPTNALMDTVAYDFPGYDVSVDVPIFPAGYYLDVGNDGREDLIVAPAADNVGLNYESVWYYKDVSAGNFVDFSRNKTTFLQDDMVDVGSASIPIVYDYNKDGLPDILLSNRVLRTPTLNQSGLALYENTGTAQAPEFTLITRDFQNLSSIFSPQLFGYAAAMGDLDDDGDLDMILGTDDGMIHYLEDTAASGMPAEFKLAGYKYANIDIGQFAMPFLEDIDDDGDLDIILGEMMGTLNLFENKGTKSAPVFSDTALTDSLGGIDVQPPPDCCTGYSAPFFYRDNSNQLQLILGSEDGFIYHYDNITNNVMGKWSLVDSTFGDLPSMKRAAPFGADLDGNGEMEWLVGTARGGLSIFTKDLQVGVDPTPVSAVLMFDLYPNPSSSDDVKIRYRLYRPENLKLTVVGIHGQVYTVQDVFGVSGTYNLETAGIPPGVHFVVLETESGAKEVRKWVKLD